MQRSFLVGLGDGEGCLSAVAGWPPSQARPSEAPTLSWDRPSPCQTVPVPRTRPPEAGLPPGLDRHGLLSSEEEGPP